VAAITVNGKRHELDPLGSVADLLEQLELTAQHVAVERNREIVPRATYAEAQLQDGDQLEIVTFVGGG
jgi:thiamine biosynthesis protein ThiS